MDSPRVAFCFHHQAPSGATLWLRDFLLTGGWPAECSIAVFPCASPLEAPLLQGGIECRRVGLATVGISDVPLWKAPGLLLNRFGSLGRYGAALRGAEVVYANSSVQIAPMLAAARLGLPLLVHVREGWHQGHTHGLKRFCVRRFAHAAAFDSSTGVELFAPSPARAVWEVSPNGVDPSLSALRADRGATRSRLGWRPDERVLLFLGTVCARKGIPDLMSVWPGLRADHPGLRLVVVGPEEASDPDPEVRAFLRERPAGVEYLGRRTDAHELIAAADLLVLPSYGEAMPISISEAMMIGTPVCARAVGDVAWQIGGGRGFLFEGGGPAPLAEALRAALASSEEASRRASAAQVFAGEHLRRETQQAQIRRLIAEAQARRR